MAKQKRDRTNLLAFTGAAALLAIAVNLAITAINYQKKNRKKKVLRGCDVHIGLSVSEIRRLADRIVAKSKEVHDAVASVPLDKLQEASFNRRSNLSNTVRIFRMVFEKDCSFLNKVGIHSSLFWKKPTVQTLYKKRGVLILQTPDTFHPHPKLDKVTYNNVILPLVELEAKQFPEIQSCVFPKWVSFSEDVRKASAEAERRIDAHVLSCSKREDVYRVVKAFAARGEWRSPEAKRYTQFLVRDFERNGLNLTSTKREELQRLKAKIDELSLRYIRHMSDDNLFLLFSEMELVGLPLEFLKRLDRAENGKIKIKLRSHHVSPVLELCKVGLTRRLVAVAYGKRCEVSLPVLEKLVQLRHKCARLLGFSNYADYAVDIRMAKSSSKVFEFLEEISASLSDLASSELTILKEMKRKEEGEVPFGVEDLQYYVKRVEEQQLNLDFGVVKQYFPVNLVLSGIFKICEDLFGLRFEEIADADVWHSSVQLFSVFDLSSSEHLGYFYLDLYSREGKYGHTCVVALQNGSSYSNAPQIPVALLISQLQEEVGGRPSLLRFSEVVNLFHEFGHVVHHICNRASFPRFSGLRLDPDFAEIPALVLENWCYESNALKMLSGFHQDITKPIEDGICNSLKRWRFSFSALKLKQEILYCLFDQIIHSTEIVDIVGLFKHLHPKVMLGLPMLEGTNPASCFPRTAIGYEAACYSHIWSEVFGADVFASKFRDDIFNQYAGMQFRNKVLAPGGSKDPIEILSDFLGREPSIQAFISSRVDSSLATVC